MFYSKINVISFSPLVFNVISLRYYTYVRKTEDFFLEAQDHANVADGMVTAMTKVENQGGNAQREEQHPISAAWLQSFTLQTCQKPGMEEEHYFNSSVSDKSSFNK